MLSTLCSAWQSSDPATVSSLILAMFLRITETDWSTIGQVADAMRHPFLRRTASDDMGEMRTASFSYTSFLRFAPLR